MPELISKYKIFLASPSDLSEERESIDQVVEELNLTFGSQNNIILELQKWETNSAPAIGSEGLQSIINNDIPEYDLFIGLLWMKFGTPTKEYGSGTEEEFNIAHQKFIKDNNSVQILFYFKNSAPQSLTEINPEQLTKIRDFKSSLGEKNVLYWEFNLKDELERLLRIHIPKRIQNLKAIPNLPTKIEEVNTDIIIVEEEDFGIIDYQEFIEESFSISTHALIRISEATNWIGDEMNKKTSEIDVLIAKNRNQPISFKVQRNIFERTANVMNDFANRIEPEIPIYINNFEKGIDSFSKLITIYINDFENKKEEIIEAGDSLDNLLIQIEFALNNMHLFLNTIDGLPKMSKELNSARKNVVNILSEFLKKLETSITIGKEVHKNIIY
ncbi:hypothetical protein FLJC2902T_14620 [Flavobacterium limnosediminis JC2902]|uniref:DUF4062 domain-containing protein n=1 Tax=Flavobacterium limnosediminis JC2902 TaxID=1341181 RepID=V6SWS0_9FLAO|nr:DUF4062 domain-containing protein [Flavobacterium limnosediminis]ESU28865.1 hypothetical protein FLJC2902T_14620 [Flavobacterium limnosediminis JC2902]